MLTHQGFQSNAVVRTVFLILGCMAFDGPPIQWAATHIKHHAHSDEDGDPHSPLDGFWHAHLGWLFSEPVDEKIYVPQLLHDEVVQSVNRLSWLWMIVSLVLPYALGGWTGLVWGAGVRIFLLSHVTWSVNSICHIFGCRDFETTDESRNQWLVGYLALGEGWHNNHHAFPRNAFHGLRWWQFDVSGMIIRALEKLGLIWDVQRVNEETLRAQRLRAASAMQTVAVMRQELLQSMIYARQELTVAGTRLMAASFTDTQTAQYKYVPQEALKRLEEIQETIARSRHLKKQKVLAYQKEAQMLMEKMRARMSMLHPQGM
jgi:stearoyl-CoA desaturase (delta-9 desaturase)